MDTCLLAFSGIVSEKKCVEFDDKSNAALVIVNLYAEQKKIRFASTPAETRNKIVKRLYESGLETTSLRVRCDEVRYGKVSYGPESSHCHGNKRKTDFFSQEKSKSQEFLLYFTKLYSNVCNERKNFQLRKSDMMSTLSYGPKQSMHMIRLFSRSLFVRAHFVYT